jgi:hypothetical protein
MNHKHKVAARADLAGQLAHLQPVLQLLQADRTHSPITGRTIVPGESERVGTSRGKQTG